MLASALAIALMTFSAGGSSSCPTIAEHIAARSGDQRGKPLELFPIYEMTAVPFEELNASAPLVVEGVATPLRTYLSEDSCRVLTEYQVSVSRVHRGSLPAATKPGVPTDQLTITTLGGRMHVDGVPIVYELQNLRPFRPGQHLLLMLAPTTETASGYGLVSLSGVFEVIEGRVRHLLDSGGGHAFPPLERAAFLQKLKGR